jgi:hypothetical protein
MCYITKFYENKQIVDKIVDVYKKYKIQYLTGQEDIIYIGLSDQDSFPTDIIYNNLYLFIWYGKDNVFEFQGIKYNKDEFYRVLDLLSFA